MYRMSAIIVVSLVLTSAGCAHHQPVLRLPALQTGDPAFAATLAAYSGATVVSGNRVEILLNGDAIFPAKLRAIRSARKTINYAQYVFDEGEPSEAVVDASRTVAGRRHRQCAARWCGHASPCRTRIASACCRPGAASRASGR